MGIYKALTDYLPEIQHCSYGEWVVDRESKGTVEDPIQMPYVSYSRMVRRFQNDVYDFMDNHPEYELNNYQKILGEHNIQWGGKIHAGGGCYYIRWKVHYGAACGSSSSRTVF